VLRHFPRIRRSRFGRCDKSDTNRNQKKGKKLAAREWANQLGVGLAEIFDDDAENRVADEKQSGQDSVRLARSRPHEPQSGEQNNPFEERFIKL
jgi:hypothetical protein